VPFSGALTIPMAWVLRRVNPNVPVDQKWRNDEGEAGQAVPGKGVREWSLRVADSGVLKIGWRY
jgi:hypothetical protein